MPLCHSGTKFHIFRLPNNIGLYMPNIFGNSDAQYIWGFRIAFNRPIGQFFDPQILNKPCFVIPGHYGCPGGFLQKSSTYRWNKKEKGFWNVFLVQKHIRDLLSDIFHRRNHVFYHPYHTVPEWQNDCFGNVTAKIYHENKVTEWNPSNIVFSIECCSQNPKEIDVKVQGLVTGLISKTKSNLN